jgi:lipid-A-disaccharide synthase
MLDRFRLEMAGAEPDCQVISLAEPAQLGHVFGFAEGLQAGTRLRAALDRAEASVRESAPDAAVLVSFSGLHLPLGRRLRRRGLPVLYLGPPQVWAWGRWRTRQLRRAADKVVCLFRFEQGLLRQAGVDAEYFGYPLLDGVVSSLSREQVLNRLGFGPEERYVVFLPGSRPAESAYHRPLFRLVFERLRKELPNIRGVAVSPEPDAGRKRDCNGSGIVTVSRNRYEVMRHADCACAVSGTVTAELAILGVPMVVSYHLPRASRLLSRAFVRIPQFALPNILDRTRLVPEVLEPGPEELARMLNPLTRDSSERRSQVAGLARVASGLGPTGAMQRICALALEMGRGGTTCRKAGRPKRG